MRRWRVAGVAVLALCMAVAARAQSGTSGVVIQVVTISTQDADTVLRRVKA